MDGFFFSKQDKFNMYVVTRLYSSRARLLPVVYTSIYYLPSVKVETYDEIRCETPNN